MFLITLPWTLVADAVPTVRSIPRKVWEGKIITTRVDGSATYAVKENGVSTAS